MQAPATTKNALPAEIAFLAEAGVDQGVLIWAARRARCQGVGADELLIAEGLIEEDAYYRALARRLNCPCLEGAAALAPGFDYRAALRASVARADPDRESFDWILSPRGKQVRDLLALSGGAPRRIAVCAPKTFSALVRAAGRRALADDAAFALSRAAPRLSACAPQLRWSNFVFILASLGLLAGVMAAWRDVFDIATLILASLFYGGIYVRLCATAASMPTDAAPAPRLSDADLPTYTIIAPLHREAAVAAQCVNALRALDYPAAKLDIKLVVEEDDSETYIALSRAGLAPYMEVVVAPGGQPRTKPRALNVALPLARGELLAIFDAEDRPEPLQLRIAAERFAVSPANVACLQARIAIDNGHENWLAYFFAISYAALFDVINPGLGELGLPMPLGGTSNHFRTALLRRMVGWDAWNVTEDADLGLRFARFGYEVHAIDAATYEDAPVTLSAWLGQRSRWMKGWMQTLAVFLRTPRAQIRKMGSFQAFAAICAMASLLAGPLFGPFYGLRLGHDLWFGDLLDPKDWRAVIVSGFSLSVVFFGLLAFVLPNVMGMRRRGLKASALLILSPVYMLLVSLAAWRALWEWTRQPFVWTKTEHAPRPGAARSHFSVNRPQAPQTAQPYSAFAGLADSE
ncbi:cellulose synthase/poly-beta-1,6-N-acetylglucosamine synthase-like glycosyltransferase [Rhodoblastus sphagnicola]|uniref:glycosyltransferase family 2 protein n=1 Tax=Rhodoblastus sphagnicola TaxID=333368 RepID=UPI001304F28A|nr:glycosyltransferase family 2 protein [Rhodoblastus sphagnicola]MBB4196901.1 cellulose synthase/poly-beta-1,6-N-acetylglucosamine synthase-like glycosyltransferase [Rhodoblastus sphagnicola]